MEVTEILKSLESGHAQAADQLLPLVYAELRQLAARRLTHEKPGQTLDATALVHEAYLRLVGTTDCRQWQGRGHFFAAAAEAMRRILIEQARRKLSLKAGGGRKRLSLDNIEIQLPQSDPNLDLLSVHDALERFEKVDPAKAAVVKLRYFVGLTIPQVAQALNISSSTADRHWAYARAWLHAEIRRASSNETP